MNRRTVNALIILGIISMMSILFVQYTWIKRTIDAQQKDIYIQKKEDSLQLKQFSENVHFALRNVLKEITVDLADSSDIYGAVKQKSTNTFTVEIHDEIHPFYLETLLKREFDKSNVRQDFQYGIYDCFSDSIVYSNLVNYQENNGNNPHADSSCTFYTTHKQFKEDSHFFTVYFPNVIDLSMNPVEELGSPWIFMVSIISLVFIFFAYAINVILKQKRLSDVKTDFINNMTHELKTPISTISLSSDMLLRGDFTNDPEKLKRYAGIIYKENKRLESQVERVLNLAKMDKDTLTLSKEPFDMHELLYEVKDNFEFNQAETGGSIQLSLEASKHILNVDPVHISNVVFNLMDNAVKYCQTMPEIYIRSRNEKNGFVMEVSDNGIGIRKEDTKMIFDKFYRVPTGNVHNVKGFGLGLYYVKLIIEQHGGTINVKSAIGKGTTFHIWLPLKTD